MPFRKTSEDKAQAPEVEKRKSERTFEDLLNQLNSPVASERRWAAKDLADYKDSANELVKRLMKEEDLSVREQIFLSLMIVDGNVAIKGIIDCLKSDDASLRNQSIETLKQMADVVAPYIENLIKSPDSDTRIFAINILESLRHPNVIKWLVEVIEGDTNVNVCATALDLLAEVGNEASLPAIEKVKERFKEEPYIQFTADLAIKRIITNTCIGILNTLVHADTVEMLPFIEMVKQQYPDNADIQAEAEKAILRIKAKYGSEL